MPPRPRPIRTRRGLLRLGFAGAALGAAALGVAPSAPAAPAATALPRAAAAPARRAASPIPINGTGSTYVGLAMQQWTADASLSGLTVNYTPTGSPDGLNRFAVSGNDFAGTEAEFASLGVVTNVPRGYQYVPDVAGAVAVMYHVEDATGRKIDYLHLSRGTIAKIFMGYITNWNDPAITADNRGLKLPSHPIRVVYRSSPSGTTGLFYDFIAHTNPGLFNSWAAKNGLSTSVRIIDLTTAPNFTPLNLGLDGSDQIAQYISSSGGTWSISYDEFGYAKTYGASAAWVDNGGGKWVLPYATNISAALESAKLRPDLSQDLSGVYTTANPLAYPISAYSYILTQCAASASRATCKGNYSNAGIAATLTKWLRYIACDGQVVDGPHRLLAPAAQPLAGDRQLDRPHERHRSGDADGRQLRQPAVPRLARCGLGEPTRPVPLTPRGRPRGHRRNHRHGCHRRRCGRDGPGCGGVGRRHDRHRRLVRLRAVGLGCRR